MTDQALPFDGLSVIITGDADGLTRDQANEAIARLGGKPVGSVSGKTGLVIVGDGAGVSKMAKTRTHRLNVIGADAFLDLIAAVDNGTWDGQPVGEPVADFEARTDPQPEPEPDPHADIPFSERHLVGRASHFPTVDGKTLGHYRMWCLKCGHRWAERLGTDVDTCPVGAGQATAFTGDWSEIDVRPFAPQRVDHTKVPKPAGTWAPPASSPASPVARRAETSAQAVAYGDVPEDPYDSFDPYADPVPSAPATPAAKPEEDHAHPGGDW